MKNFDVLFDDFTTLPLSAMIAVVAVVVNVVVNVVVDVVVDAVVVSKPFIGCSTTTSGFHSNFRKFNDKIK